MSYSDSLYRLVHSLNRKEKLSFRSYARRRNDPQNKNYIRLFDAIAAQSTYNEEALRHKFRKEKFARQFAVAKNYLYELILETIAVYYQRNTVAAQLFQMMQGIDVLYARGLYTEAWRLLRKAKKLSAGGDFPVEQLRLLQLEQNFVIIHAPLAEQADEYERLGNEERELLLHYQADREYLRLGRIWGAIIIQYGHPRNQQELDRYRPFFEHPLLREEAAPTRGRAISDYYYLRVNSFLLQGRFADAYRVARDEVERIEALMAGGAKYLGPYNDYRTALYNLLLEAIHLPRFDAYFDEKWNSLKQLITAKKQAGGTPAFADTRWLLTFYNLEAERRIAAAELGHSTRLAATVEKELHRNSKLAEQLPISELYRNMGLLLFYSGHYDAALTWFHRMLNQPYAKSQEDLYGWVRIFSLIAHFELGHERLLEYSIRRTRYYLGKMERLYEAERSILHFFDRELPRITDRVSLHKALQKLHGTFVKLQASPFEAHILRQFDLPAWLQSRIRKKPLPDIIREKAKEKK